MFTIMLVSLLSTNGFAGSICKDGTYSYSEGKGTCSWHGGVRKSGIESGFAEPQRWGSNTYSTTSSNSGLRNNIGNTSSKDALNTSMYGWSNHSTSDSSNGVSSILNTTIFTDRDLNSFHYSCRIDSHGSIEESFGLHIQMPGFEDSKDWSISESDLRVFTLTSGGYHLFSGSWVWKYIEGTLSIVKIVDNGHYDSKQTWTLTKTDIVNITSSERFTISIDGYANTTIFVPNIFLNVKNTWSMCNAIAVQVRK